MASRFLHQPGDRMFLLDLDAVCSFKSETSISFDLGHSSEGLFQVIGWLDLHYPCEYEFCRAQIRLSLPESYGDPEQVRHLLRELFSAFAIPAEESYELLFITSNLQLRFMNRQDVI